MGGIKPAHIKGKGGPLGLSHICKEFSITRDAYYKHKKRQEAKSLIQETALSLVKSRRGLQSREGGRKLFVALQPEFRGMKLKIGRDKLFDILRSHGMLVKPRRLHAKTTNSMHKYNTYANLAEGFTPTGKNQLWVSDITYIRAAGGFLYLALVTDAYSRKIVGYDISNSLELEGALSALNLALRQLPAGHRLIHHSDRGIQYCSNAYIGKLNKNKVRVSMAGKGNCYENAMAERVNGILKQEYYIDQAFKNRGQAIKACKQAIEIYNKHRLHMAIGYKTPNQMHKSVA